MLDLHFHSTRSDGRKTPQDIIDLAHPEDILACTDHDFVNTEFVALAREKGVRTCESVEVSAYDPETPDQIQLHVTYYAKQVNSTLLQKLEGIRSHKIARLQTQADRLRENWIHVDLVDFVRYFEGLGFDKKNLNNAHLSMYIYRDPKNIEQIQKLTGEALDQMEFVYECLKFNGRYSWIGVGREDLRPKCNIAIRELLTLAQDDDAVTSIAHPNYSIKTVARYKELVPKYLSLGASAVEINATSNQEWIDLMLASKKQYWHLLTFGSDCHFKKETDNKHGDFGQMNPLLVPEFIIEETQKALGAILL